MTPEYEKKEGGQTALRALKLVIAIVVALIIIGSIAALVFGTRQKKLEREAAALALMSEGGANAAAQAVFTGIGRIRASSAGKKSALIVVTVAFPYDAEDRAFAEELLKKNTALQAAVKAFFEQKRADELDPAYEGALKAALMGRLNALLSLGKIEELWFSDFAVIE